MLLDDLWLVFQYLGHGQKSEVLEVLIGVFDEQPQLRDAELNRCRVIGYTDDHRGNTLVEQGHGSGAVNEVGQRLNELLTKTRLKGSERTKLSGGMGGGGGEEGR